MAKRRRVRHPNSRIRGKSSLPEPAWKRPYDRIRELPRLVPILAEDVVVRTPRDHARLIALLRKALRAERVRARGRHWAYDPARHAALVRAFRTETELAAAGGSDRTQG